MKTDEDNVVIDNGGFKATVTRPKRNQEAVSVVITATANVNGATATKEFTLTVTPEDALKAYPGVEATALTLREAEAVRFTMLQPLHMTVKVL